MLKTPLMSSSVRLPESWKQQLLSEFQKPYMQQLKAFLIEQIKGGKTIFPPPSKYFKAFDLAPFDQVKVVILGQDPYHGPGQAEGLCFSVPEGIAMPPSLKNIFKELKSDLGCPPPQTGSLIPWAKQGVLLLNATLTVQARQAGSHQNQGWEEFTDQAVQVLNDHKQGLVFMLWGAYAQQKGAFISEEKHLVLKAPHPSPFSADRGFFGCRHFSQANAYLKKQGLSVINWAGARHAS